MHAISLTIACSLYIHNGVILHAHPVRGESHNQRNTTGEVATVSMPAVRLFSSSALTIWFGLAGIEVGGSTSYILFQKVSRLGLG